MNLETEIRRLRGDTPGCQQLIHFNNAGFSLSPAVVVETVIGHLQLEQKLGGYEAAEQATQKIDNFYRAFARMLNCQPEEVAYSMGGSFLERTAPLHARGGGGEHQRVGRIPSRRLARVFVDHVDAGGSACLGSRQQTAHVLRKTRIRIYGLRVAGDAGDQVVRWRLRVRALPGGDLHGSRFPPSISPLG